MWSKITPQIHAKLRCIIESPLCIDVIFERFSDLMQNMPYIHEKYYLFTILCTIFVFHWVRTGSQCLDCLIIHRKLTILLTYLVTLEVCESIRKYFCKNKNSRKKQSFYKLMSQKTVQILTRKFPFSQTYLLRQ